MHCHLRLVLQSRRPVPPTLHVVLTPFLTQSTDAVRLVTTLCAVKRPSSFLLHQLLLLLLLLLQPLLMLESEDVVGPGEQLLAFCAITAARPDLNAARVDALPCVMHILVVPRRVKIALSVLSARQDLSPGIAPALLLQALW